MVDMAKLKFVDEPARTAANNNKTGSGAAGGNATTGAGSNNANANNANTNNANANNGSRNRWYPDHAILAGATKDSLKAMKEFKYD
jgi:hypothetical protein